MYVRPKVSFKSIQYFRIKERVIFEKWWGGGRRGTQKRKEEKLQVCLNSGNFRVKELCGVMFFGVDLYENPFYYTH